MKYVISIIILFVLTLFLPTLQSKAPTTSIPSDLKSNGKKSNTTCQDRPNAFNGHDVLLYTYQNEYNLLVFQIKSTKDEKNAVLAVYQSAQSNFGTTAIEKEKCWKVQMENEKEKVSFISASAHKIKGTYQIKDNYLIVYLYQGAYLIDTLKFKKTTVNEVNVAIKEQKENADVYRFLNEWEEMKRKSYNEELAKNRANYKKWVKAQTFSITWLTSQEQTLHNQRKQVANEEKTVKWLFERAFTNKGVALDMMKSTNAYDQIVTNDKYIQYEQDVTAFTIHYKEYRRLMNVLKYQRVTIENVIKKGTASESEKKKLVPLIKQYDESINQLTISKNLFYKMLGVLTREVSEELQNKT